MSALDKATLLVFEFFKDDPFKAILWFTTPNPNLGCTTPLKLIQSGRGAKVVKFIHACVEENTL